MNSMTLIISLSASINRLPHRDREQQMCESPLRAMARAVARDPFCMEIRAIKNWNIDKILLAEFTLGEFELNAKAAFKPRHQPPVGARLLPPLGI
jgi:hypothetical protein